MTKTPSEHGRSNKAAYRNALQLKPAKRTALFRSRVPRRAAWSSAAHPEVPWCVTDYFFSS